MSTTTTTTEAKAQRRFHWGHGIALFFLSFVAFMLFMLYMCMQQSFDLVTEDYYEQELRYETRIKARQNVSALLTAPHVFWQSDALMLRLPVEELPSDLKGEIYAFSPVSRSRDRRTVLALDASGQQTLSTSEWAAGAYDVQISFTAGGQEYFVEQRVEVTRR